MSRRPSTLDQSLGIGGSDFQSDTMDSTLEPLELGQVVSGQSGVTASVSAVVGSVVTMIGLSGITQDSVGRFITISGANSVNNNGTFLILAVFGATTINYENALAVAGDLNNGSILWVEREPYTLEDDINYSRTDRRLIKGTANWYDNIPTYIRPTDGLTHVNANLTNIAGNTLDAHAILESRSQESVSVLSGMSFITITDVGNLKHADSVDQIGVPISDGYDAGNDKALFVEIVDAEMDGYGDGFNLKVLGGAHVGNRIFGQTRAGASVSPNSVEIVFFSTSIDDWSLSSAIPYTWEANQPTLINVDYSYRQRLDLFDETAIRSTLIKGALSGGGDSSGGSTGITEATHNALRTLIHFIDDGPAEGFVSGAFKEILPSGPFPTSYIWWESVAKINKILELSIIRDSRKNPISEEWKMYDTDGVTILTTVTDTILYSGPFETSRTRTIVT